MNVLVTGATGFLGGAAARKLHQQGHRVLATGRNADLGRVLQQEGIEFRPAELADADTILDMCRDIDWVLHSGAKSSLWGSKSDFWKPNVVGTENVVQGCLKHKVKRLVYVSSPSVYFSFGDQLDITEDFPLPEKFVNSYTASKRQGELQVLRGHSLGLNSIILRPRAIFGPRDTSIFPRLLRAMKEGKLRVIGSGENKCSLTYIDNCVDGCIAGLRAAEDLSGRTYNITDGEDIYLWETLKYIASSLGFSLPKRTISLRFARTLARSMEKFHRVFLPTKEPVLTEYSVGLLGCSTTLDITKAKEELGYQPKISTQQGIDLFLKWWKECS